MIREAVVSGQFYPQNPEQLQQVIKDFSPDKGTKTTALGVILPHAGYVYSGKVAVTTVSKVAAKKKVVLLGPNHSTAGASFALWPDGKWNTPLGEVLVDEKLSKDILDKGSIIEKDYRAHQYEHSLEVQLPILQYFFAGFEIVPISCKLASLEQYQEAASQLYEALRHLKGEVLVVASTDMTHYEPDASARKKDRMAIEHIVSLNEEKLLETVARENITMCGVDQN